MKRATTGNEAKRANRPSSGPSSTQRMAAAGLRALEAHGHVRRFAERLGGELESAGPHDVLTADLKPEDPVVVAVEKAIAATSTMVAVEKAIARTSPPTAAPGAQAPSTKLGIGPPAKGKTKIGIGPPAKRASTDDE